MDRRMLILTAILIIIDLIAFQALRFVLSGFSRPGRIIAYSLYWMVPVLAILYVYLLMSGRMDGMSKGVQSVVRALIFISYFAKFLVAVVLLIDDLRRLLFGALNLGLKETKLPTDRSSFMTYGALILGAIPLFSLTYGMARNPYRYKIRRATIPVKGLDPDLDGLTIGQISDIHSGSFLFKEPVERSVDMLMKENPDIIFFTGDLINSQAREMEPFLDVFGKLSAPLGIYSILGNHDYGDYHQWNSKEEKVRNFEDLKGMHARMGWNLLLNEHVRLQHKTAGFNVIGVENYSASARFPKYGDLQKATDGMNRDSFNVLLSHDPSHWNAQVTNDHQDIHLTLSGHTHGFQFGVEIPGLKWSPVQYVYPQWAGLYEKGEQFLYVNRGLGYLGYPGRVGILPEITILTLKAL